MASLVPEVMIVPLGQSISLISCPGESISARQSGRVLALTNNGFSPFDRGCNQWNSTIILRLLALIGFRAKKQATHSRWTVGLRVSMFLGLSVPFFPMTALFQAVTCSIGQNELRTSQKVTMADLSVYWFKQKGYMWATSYGAPILVTIHRSSSRLLV